KPFKGFTILLYTLMGWACLAVMPQLIHNLPANAFSVLLAGGIAYTLGIPFYIMRKEFCHALWHFFVLAGAVLHFLCIYFVFLN
ncbi:MAG: hemolysin III family protein, partial [Lentisphaeria bacterium]|nr:hemolysin III family protein [Lentisphaeria bacterium]MBR4075528.1 hemolysin III family protein [Lentisphaeria bacterium]